MNGHIFFETFYILGFFSLISTQLVKYIVIIRQLYWIFVFVTPCAIKQIKKSSTNIVVKLFI